MRKTHSRAICLWQIRNKCMSSCLNSQTGTGTCLKILLSQLNGCMGAVTSGNLWLFVPVSHQSASVKANSAGDLTSTLQIHPPPPSTGFFYSPLFVYMLNTRLNSNPVCSELENAKLPLFECKCKIIYFFSEGYTSVNKWPEPGIGFTMLLVEVSLKYMIFCLLKQVICRVYVY